MNYMKLFLLYNGNKQNNDIHPDRQRLKMGTILLSLSTSALLILSFGFSFQSPVIAQITSTTADNNIVKNNNFASSFKPVVASSPLIIKTSNKGFYEVQLGWNAPMSLQSLPNSGFSTYITFTSARLPPATSKTIPNF